MALALVLESPHYKAVWPVSLIGNGDHKALALYDRLDHGKNCRVVNARLTAALADFEHILSGRFPSHLHTIKHLTSLG